MTAHALITHAPLGSAERSVQLEAGAPNVTVCVCGHVAGAQGPWDVQLAVCTGHGVTLGKGTDRYPMGSGVIVVPSEGELDRRRGVRNPRVDAMVPGHEEGLSMNDHETLRSVFAILAR